MNQFTLARPVVIQGVGLHGGREAQVTVQPAADNTGIRFRRVDLPGQPSFLARPQCVAETRLCTELRGPGGASVSTVEHLMAALWAAGIDNALIDVQGPEVPIMDGSAQPLLERMVAGGARRQRAPRAVIRILKPVMAQADGAWASLSPADGFSMRFSIDFAHPAIGHQEEAVVMDESTFRWRIAPARTFGFLDEVEQLRRNGLALGGSLDNAVVVGADGVLNPGGLRCPTEFVRHKMLDAVGDLYLLGARIIGHFEGCRSSHALNVSLLQQLLGARGAWRRETVRGEQPAPVTAWQADSLSPAFV